ncbi:unnamed protein product [Musa acuminata subsp. malaccensis]|uniref:(wild Malaysian banana) hypothetical protein n=1 Tax=Musa acuminata subsp. malaccensis TaxID=214687 RepID=A0A804KV65_MUSAM|nr:unnamed protein product [Musa acuminata subsp. malaccensis]
MMVINYKMYTVKDNTDLYLMVNFSSKCCLVFYAAIPEY